MGSILIAFSTQIQKAKKGAIPCTISFYHIKSLATVSASSYQRWYYRFLIDPTLVLFYPGPFPIPELFVPKEIITFSISIYKKIYKPYLKVKTECFPFKSGKRQGCLLWSLPFKFGGCVGGFSQYNNKKKRVTNWEGRSKTVFIHKQHSLVSRKS